MDVASIKYDLLSTCAKKEKTSLRKSFSKIKFKKPKQTNTQRAMEQQELQILF